MRSSGQSALDLLLSLLVLLIVLTVFSSVLTRFEEVQKEMSIRQQLRENLSQIHWLSSYAASQFHEISSYPATASVPVGFALSSRTNAYARTSGTVLLKPVRATGVQTAIDCSIIWDINAEAVEFKVSAPPSSTGLPYPVDVNRTTVANNFMDDNHTFIFSGCFNQFTIEADP